MKTLLTTLIVLSAAAALAQKPVTTEFPLKWKTKIGITTYRTNMILHDGLLYIGSNGKNRDSRLDELDGVYAIDPKTGTVKATYKIPFAGDNDVTGINIADNKLFFGTDNYYFFCFDLKTGQELWKRPLPYDVESAPVNADFDRDGTADVSFSVQGHGFYALNGATGEQLWLQDSISSHGGNVASLLVDVNADGTPDIVNAGRGNPNSDDIDGFKMAHYGDYHFALDGSNGHFLWYTSSGAGIHPSPFLFEANGKQQIALLDCYGDFQTVDLSGNRQSKVSIGYGWFSSPVMTSDRHLIVGNLSVEYTDEVMMLSEYDALPYPGDSAEVNSIQLQDDEVISATTMIADVLGKGSMQGIGVTEKGTLFLMELNGKEIKKLKLPGKGAEASPFIGDVDGDGKLEIVIADLDGNVYCFDTGSRGKVEVGGFR